MDYFRINAKDGNYNGEQFLAQLDKSGLLESYEFYQLGSPVHTFRDDFLNYISKHGLKSLFYFSMSMEDITSPSMTIDDVENMILKFTSQLNGANKILITDPYLYAKNPNIVLFKKMLRSFESNLQELVLVTNRIKIAQNDIINAVEEINPKIKITKFETERFHDRFWIDVNNENGIVIGTSLNGIGKRIACVDKLSTSDVQTIIEEVKTIGVPNL